MEWKEYKRLCDSPQVFSRWMLGQTIELLGEEAPLADALALVLCGRPLEKPHDHRGGLLMDMFEVILPLSEATAIHRIVRDAARAGRATSATRPRGLGGFEETWREYAAYVERTQRCDARQEDISRMSRASKVVTDLIDSFNVGDLDRIMEHFGNDAVYHNMPVAPVFGPKAIRDVLQGFMGMASKVDWQVRNLVEGDDGVVLTERVDRFLINGRWVELPVMGTFEVAGGKIVAWRDYFDMNQFQSQLAG
jgi:limonene-1,2-epoxide hydrolase